MNNGNVDLSAMDTHGGAPTPVMLCTEPTKRDKSALDSPLDNCKTGEASPSDETALGSPEWWAFVAEVLGPNRVERYTPRRHASAWQWMVVHLRAMFGWRDGTGAIAPPLGRSFAWGPKPSLLSADRTDPLQLPAEFRAFIVLSRNLGCEARPVIMRKGVEPPLAKLSAPGCLGYSLGVEGGVGWEILAPTDPGLDWAALPAAQHAALNARVAQALLPKPGTPGAWALQTGPDSMLRLRPLLAWFVGEHARERLMAPMPGNRMKGDPRRFPFNTLAAAEARLLPSRVPIYAEIDFEPPRPFEVLPPITSSNPQRSARDSTLNGVKRTGYVCPAPWPPLRDDNAEPWPPETPEPSTPGTPEP